MDSEVEPTGAEPVALSDIDSIIADATPQERAVRICVKGHLRARYEELERQLREAEQLDDGAELSELAEQVKAAAADVERSMVPFTFRSIGWKWRALYLQYANDQDEIADVGEYARQAVAATASSPKMTVEQAQQLFDVLAQGDIDALFNAAIRVNVGATVDIPKSLRASQILGRKRSVTS